MSPKDGTLALGPGIHPDPMCRDKQRFNHLHGTVRAISPFSARTSTPGPVTGAPIAQDSLLSLAGRSSDWAV